MLNIDDSRVEAILPKNNIEPAGLQRMLDEIDQFVSVENRGIHVLASMDPIDVPAANQLAVRLRETARRDLLEWNPTDNATTYLQNFIINNFSVVQYLNPNPDICITEDHPFNEYFLLRRSFLPGKGAKR